MWAALPLLFAQASYPPAAIDPATVATKSDVQAVQTMAASKCDPNVAVPPPEVVGGSAGSGSGCRLANAVQPRITRTVAFTTGAAGTASVLWTDMGAVPLVFVVPNASASQTQAPTCLPISGTITSTGAQVRCWTSQSVTVSILGAVVAPITTAGAGVTGQVLAIPAS